jgi:hypothetical protein
MWGRWFSLIKRICYIAQRQKVVSDWTSRGESRSLFCARSALVSIPVSPAGINSCTQNLSILIHFTSLPFYQPDTLFHSRTFAKYTVLMELY